MHHKSYTAGIKHFVVSLAIALAIIVLFRFLFMGEWDTIDSFFELKLGGYYTAIAIVCWFLVQGLSRRAQKRQYLLGFFTLPIVFATVLILAALSAKIYYSFYGDDSFGPPPGVPWPSVQTGFGGEKLKYDDNLRDILPLNPLSNGDIPNHVGIIREAIATKDLSGCNQLSAVMYMSGVQLGDIALFSPNGSNWKTFCTVLVNNDPEYCVNIPDHNTSDSGWKTSVTRPNLQAECQEYFKIKL